MDERAFSCACTIAGSDSGGGAGVQADQKVFHSLGVWGLSVITAVTAQNTREVRGSIIIPPDFVGLQLETVLDDFEIGAFKTGMLGDATTIHTIADCLPSGIALVVDPVMVSTSGYPLLEKEAKSALVERLLPRSTVVTPNIAEAVVLSGMDKITTLEDAREAAFAILDQGPEYVVMKGGHLAIEQATDLLIARDGEWAESGTRYPYSVHGSGCCFSAALAAYLAMGRTVPEAFHMAKIFIDHAIGRAVRGRSGKYMVNP
ncbi:MAG TPA: bifunctional hydroxymethylpyrimidine kinase/phosphomethylpyrimidine kinase [Methanoregulaceae archaeon]|nr:bifunctional hydroxymethylpyrimidine kinase/phosphomethylpyrimidine kinase [Methanoregulaceae archaeon]